MAQRKINSERNNAHGIICNARRSIDAALQIALTKKCAILILGYRRMTLLAVLLKKAMTQKNWPTNVTFAHYAILNIIINMSF